MIFVFMSDRCFIGYIWGLVLDFGKLDEFDCYGEVIVEEVKF